MQQQSIPTKKRATKAEIDNAKVDWNKYWKELVRLKQTKVVTKKQPIDWRTHHDDIVKKKKKISDVLPISVSQLGADDPQQQQQEVVGGSTAPQTIFDSIESTHRSNTSRRKTAAEPDNYHSTFHPTSTFQATGKGKSRFRATRASSQPRETEPLQQSSNQTKKQKLNKTLTDLNDLTYVTEVVGKSKADQYSEEPSLDEVDINDYRERSAMHSTVSSPLLQGTYHFGKAYYTNFIKYENRDVFQRQQHRRAAFIPQDKVHQKTFKDKFHMHLEHFIQAEEEEKEQQRQEKVAIDREMARQLNADKTQFQKRKRRSTQWSLPKISSFHRDQQNGLYIGRKSTLKDIDSFAKFLNIGQTTQISDGGTPLSNVREKKLPRHKLKRRKAGGLFLGNTSDNDGKVRHSQRFGQNSLSLGQTRPQIVDDSKNMGDVANKTSLNISEQVLDAILKERERYQMESPMRKRAEAISDQLKVFHQLDASRKGVVHNPKVMRAFDLSSGIKNRSTQQSPMTSYRSDLKSSSRRQSGSAMTIGRSTFRRSPCQRFNEEHTSF